MLTETETPVVNLTGWTVDAERTSLAVITDDGVRHGLPWSHFIGLEMKRNSEIVLSFSSKTFVVKGISLDPLAELIEDFRVRKMEAKKGNSHRFSTGNGQARYIESITVEEKTEE